MRSVGSPLPWAQREPGKQPQGVRWPLITYRLDSLQIVHGVELLGYMVRGYERKEVKGGQEGFGNGGTGLKSSSPGKMMMLSENRLIALP